MCYGPPGVGKSGSALAYTDWDAIDRTIEQSKRREGFVAPHKVRFCDAVFHTAPVVNSAKIIERGIERARERLFNAINLSHEETDDDENHYYYSWNDVFTRLIIVDEVDRLKIDGLEMLRSIFDRDRLGLVLIGMPGLEKRLARYPQLYSRIGFAHHFRTLSNEEVVFLIEMHLIKLLNLQDFTDREALSAVVRITQGNFRLLNKLLAQIRRILEINKLRTLTQEIVEMARESLVVGVL